MLWMQRIALLPNHAKAAWMEVLSTRQSIRVAAPETAKSSYSSFITALHPGISFFITCRLATEIYARLGLIKHLIYPVACGARASKK